MQATNYVTCHQRREGQYCFVWNDLDRLFGHLQELATDLTSGFGLPDAQAVMALARRQLWQSFRNGFPAIRRN